jgi:hypothetical protein
MAAGPDFRIEAGLNGGAEIGAMPPGTIPKYPFHLEGPLIKSPKQGRRTLVRIRNAAWTAAFPGGLALECRSTTAFPPNPYTVGNSPSLRCGSPTNVSA